MPCDDGHGQRLDPHPAPVTGSPLLAVGPGAGPRGALEVDQQLVLPPCGAYAAQRALEVGADVLLMSKNGVDGVYDSDPRTNPDARRYDDLSYNDFLAQDLKVADATAVSLARDNGLPMVFFDLGVRGNIARIVNGEKIGTTVHA